MEGGGEGSEGGLPVSDDSSLKAMAYADDIIVFAQSAEEHQMQLEKAQSWAVQNGMSFTPAKSAILTNSLDEVCAPHLVKTSSPNVTRPTTWATAFPCWMTTKARGRLWFTSSRTGWSACPLSLGPTFSRGM